LGDFGGLDIQKAVDSGEANVLSLTNSNYNPANTSGSVSIMMTPHGNYIRKGVKLLAVKEGVYGGQPTADSGFGIYTSNADVWTLGLYQNKAGYLGLATVPTRILGIGGLEARNIGMERGTVADTAGFALTLNAGAATVASTDKAGGYIDIKGGLSTGNAETGVRLYGNTAGASGTADSAYYLMHHILGNKQAWFNTSPAVKQTGYAVPTDLASCIAALTAWRTAAINYGLMTTV